MSTGTMCPPDLCGVPFSVLTDEPTCTLERWRFFAPTATQFTAKLRDYESGLRLDYFGARYLSASMGRFTIANPGNAGAVPGDPQTWNAYSYVYNRPLQLTDPDGRCPWCVGAAAGTLVGALAQVVTDVATDKPVTFRKTAAAAIGGAIVGGTAGAASELGIAVQIALVGDAGVVAGITERGIETGSVDDPGVMNLTSMVRDFALTGATHGAAKGAEEVVTKLAGGAVENLSGQLGRARTVNRQQKVAGRLEKATEKLDRKKTVASTANQSAAEIAARSQEKTQDCREGQTGCS